MSRYKWSSEIRGDREVWDAWGPDGLHLMALQMRPGQNYAAMASIPERFGEKSHGDVTDFVFETPAEAMRESERLGEIAASLRAAEGT